MGDRPPKPSRQDLISTAMEFKQLYSLKEPPGDPIPTHINPFPIPDTIPTEEEIIKAVKRLHTGKSTGPSRMKAEHFKTWYKEAYPDPPKNDTAPPPKPFTENWDALVSITQHIFATGNIPTKANHSFLTVIPKPQGGARGISLLEILWKLIEAIIDTRIKTTVTLHNVLHGF
jgi:hypothetical protein